MNKCIISDFSRVLLFPRDRKYVGKLNDLHANLLKLGDYDFWDYFELNKGLFEFYRSLSKENSLYIFTSEYIQDYPPVRKVLCSVFIKIFTAIELEVKKDEYKAYIKLADLLNIRTNEIIYIDDSKINIEAASKAGMATILFKNNDQTILEIKKNFQ